MSQPAFQSFQLALGQHLRDPHHAPRPVGVPARRLAIYGELLFNNLTGFLDACFPICRELLGETRWRRLNRTFYRDWHSQTPWFREIPREFVRYLQASDIRQPLPRWLPELAHYEWVELAVDIMEVSIPTHDPQGDLLQGKPLLNPVLMNLAYAWPVHRIAPDYRPRQAQETRLLVFRDTADEIHFAAINPVTARLLQLLEAGELSGRAACLRVAQELQHPDPGTVIDFGARILDDLRQQGAILGVQR